MFKHWEFITTMIAIVGLGLSLATLNITLYNGLRSDMQAMRAEARADREAWEAESARLRAEDRADREAWGGREQPAPGRSPRRPRGMGGREHPSPGRR